MGLIKNWVQNTVSRRGFIVMFGSGLYQFVFKKYARANTLYLRANEFQIRSIEDTQHVDLKTWQLRIEGLIEKGLSLRFDEIHTLPKKIQVKNFQCVEGWGLDDQRWEGVHLKEIFSNVKINPKAKYVTFHATGGKYKDSLSIQEALEPDTILAYKLNGKNLTPENGFPLRLVIPRMYGYKGVKWVERIVFTEKQEIGYWELRGYPVDGSIPSKKS